MSTPRKYAVRNLRLCTKDCICLFVCPYGATDTENSVIDVDKCNELITANAVYLTVLEYLTYHLAGFPDILIARFVTIGVIDLL